MSRHALVPATLALLAVLAGCSLPAGPGTGGDTPTLTPAPVGTETGTPPVATPTPDAVVPGVASDRVRDPFALAGAHRTALRNRSFVRVIDERIVGPNGTLWRERTETAAGDDRERLHFRKNATSAPDYPVSALRPDLQIYYDGNASYFRGTIDGEVTYAAVGGTAADVLDDVVEHDRLVVLYGAFRFRVRDTGDGYRLVGARPRDPDELDAPPLVENPRNASLVVEVTETGRVESYRLAFDGTLRDSTVRVTRTVEFRDVGAMTVEPPTWYDAAVNETA